MIHCTGQTCIFPASVLKRSSIKFYIGSRVSDDPYYCGLRARIPNFAKSKAQKEKEAKYGRIGDRRDKDGHPMVWHGPQRGYLENGESK